MNEGWTVSRLSAACHVDKGTVTKVLKEAGLDFTLNGKAHLYDPDKAISILVEGKSDQTSTDRRNNAQAEKAEVETGILKKTYIPIAEVIEPVSKLVSALQRALQDCDDMPSEAKEQLIDRIHGVFAHYAENGLELEKDETQN